MILYIFLDICRTDTLKNSLNLKVVKLNDNKVQTVFV